MAVWVSKHVIAKPKENQKGSHVDSAVLDQRTFILPREISPSRYCIWHHWKKPERKRKNLLRLGVDNHQAYAWSRTRMGGWAVAQSPILVTTITLERLRKRGYEALYTHYKKIAPHLNEPLYTRPVRTVV